MSPIERLNPELIESIEHILILNEKNNQIRFEAIERQIERLTETVTKIAESVAQQSIGLAEYRETTKQLLNSLAEHKQDITRLENKVEMLTMGASGNKVMISVISTTMKIIFAAFVGGAIATYWFLVRNGSPPV